MFKLVTFPLRVAWAVFVVLVPLLGVWLASSLTAYYNGPVWAACVVGALLFPVVPLLWELRASSRWSAKHGEQQDDEEPAKRWLSFWDRMTLRTLVLNLLFIGGLLASFPAQGFTALSTRGDWMLQEQTSAEAGVARETLFAAASGLEGLHNLARDNPYEKFDDGSSESIEPAPNPIPVDPVSVAPVASADPDEKPAINTPTQPARRELGKAPRWPMMSRLHPAVVSLPADQETSIESVANYIAAQESDPFMRVKALHDYVADRVAYDAPALARGDYPPQDAQTVFEKRVAVCAGYAKLLEKLGEYTGDEIVYISGDSRDTGGDIAGGGHAWNAAKIEGRWYLMDATWDAGTVSGTTFTKTYSSAYLFTPPRAFVHDHYPDNAAWQLLKEPISKGDFVRLPVLKADFFAKGLEMVSPQRSQVSAQGDSFTVQLKSHKNIPLLARIVSKGQVGSKGDRCEINGVDNVAIRCKIPGTGAYQVWIFANTKGTMYTSVGHVELLKN